MRDADTRGLLPGSRKFWQGWRESRVSAIATVIVGGSVLSLHFMERRGTGTGHRRHFGMAASCQALCVTLLDLSEVTKEQLLLPPVYS